MRKKDILRNDFPRILELYNKGYSTVKIAKEYDCNCKLVWYVLREKGVDTRAPFRYKQSTIERYSSLVEYMERVLNKGRRVISKQLHIKESLVKMIFDNLDIDSSKRFYKIDRKITPEVVKLYNQGFSADLISDKYGCDVSVIIDIVKKNCEIYRPSEKYTHNEQMFSDGIKTKEEAYIFGLWLTDGNVRHNVISLGLTDRDVVEKVHKFLGGTYPIKVIDRVEKGKIRKTVYRLAIYDVKLAKKFTELGCPPKKSHILDFPYYMKDELMPDFLRGVLEGDGHIRKTHCGVTGNLPFLKGIQSTLIRLFNLKEEDFHFYKCKEQKREIYTIALTKKATSKPFLDFIYKNSIQSLRMDRKYEIYSKYWLNMDIKT